MASIRERPRKDGTICFAVLYWIGDRQSSTPFDDKKSAEAFRLAVEVHGPQRACTMYGIDPSPRRRAEPEDAMTLVDWVRHYIDNLTGNEQYTTDVYNRYLENDIHPFFGDVGLAALEREDVVRWIKHMESTPTKRTGKPLAPKTIANKHGFLSGALNGAVKAKLIPGNPAANNRLPRKTGSDDDSDDKDIRMLSQEEFARLEAAGTVAYWKPFVRFLVLSGCRWGEATALRPGDVDRRAGTVRVLRAWKKSSLGYNIGAPKTKRSKRVINVDRTLLAQLDYSHEYLFTNTNGRPIRYGSFKGNVWDRAVAAAQLDPRPTPHALRHTCASWMLNSGVALTTVSRHLGHESIKVTADIYGDVDRTTHAAAADIIGQLLREEPE